MNISDAELWAKAFVLSEKILNFNDREALAKRGSVQAMLMLAYMEGKKDAKDHTQGPS